jgi:hypothetical protein
LGNAFEVAFLGFLLATFLFLASTLGGWAILEWIAEKKNAKYTGKAFYVGTYVGFVFGLLAFLVGVVGTAFLRSTLAGIVAIGTGLAIVVFFVTTVVGSPTNVDHAGCGSARS